MRSRCISLNHPFPTKLFPLQDTRSHNGGMKPRNIIGPQIRKLRYQRGWSQNHLTGKLQLLGYDRPRSGIGKIESGYLFVCDSELPYFAAALGVTVSDLFPDIALDATVHDSVTHLLKERKTHCCIRRERKSGCRRKTLRQ